MVSSKILRLLLFSALGMGATVTDAAAVMTAATANIRLAPQDTSLKIDANNYSASPVLTTYTWPDNKVANAIVLKFDTSAIPRDASIEQATLHLALLQSDTSLDLTYTVSAHKILSKETDVSKATGYTADGVTAWTASSCCYKGVPLAQNDISPPYDRQVIDKVPGDKAWTITSIVQEWLADPATNFGLLLNSDASKPRARYRFFASMEYAIAALRPYLEVKYTSDVSSQDASPPAVSISSPADASNVSGTVPIEAGASDDVGVVGVQFKVNGVNLGPEDTTSPYSVSWNTTTVADGPYAITAVARDAAAKQTTSAVVTVNVSNAASSPPSSILWSADHEEGDMSDWYTASGGGEFNSGGISIASSDVAHSGRYSAKATISAPPTTGARLFRWNESRANQEAYYSTWVYFPQVYTPSWWIVFLYKSRASSTTDPDPFWFVQVGNRQDGAMYFFLTWWYGPWPGGTVEGPHQGESGGRDYRQTIKDIPVGKWVHLEAYLRQSAGFTGQIIVWQDGVEILNQNNVKTRYPYMGNEWALSSYSESISPSPATIYFDDAAISTQRLGPGMPNGGAPPASSVSAPPAISNRRQR